MDKKISEIKLIAGPCSAESREQVLETAAGLKGLGLEAFRAGLWKPRSNYGTFEGVGTAGLPWMKEVQAMGMKIITEVALPRHVEAVLEAGFDMVWIGARTTVSPFMMSELAAALRGVDIPVFVKNPVSPDIKLWVGGMERLAHENIKDIRAVHRGFYLLDNSPYRNSPLWQCIGMLKENYPDMPLYCDPSHIAGKRALVPEICQRALEEGVDGLFIESHTDPSCALSDASQQLEPDDLKKMLELLK